MKHQQLKHYGYVANTVHVEFPFLVEATWKITKIHYERSRPPIIEIFEYWTSKLLLDFIGTSSRSLNVLSINTNVSSMASWSNLSLLWARYIYELYYTKKAWNRKMETMRSCSFQSQLAVWVVSLSLAEGQIHEDLRTKIHDVNRKCTVASRDA